MYVWWITNFKMASFFTLWSHNSVAQRKPSVINFMVFLDLTESNRWQHKKYDEVEMFLIIQINEQL